MSTSVKIMPSILGAHPGRLEAACLACMNAGADGLHIDIMDGHFVPNLSFGPSMVAMAAKAAPLHRNVHLMISNPTERAMAFVDAGAQTLHVHVETDTHLDTLLAQLASKGVRPGLAINPATPWEPYEPLMNRLGEVLFMTVVPGFGGQAFMDEVLPKISSFRTRFPALDIAVDGGLNRDTVPRCREAGANIFHIGSHLFNAPNLGEEIAWFREKLG